MQNFRNWTMILIIVMVCLTFTPVAAGEVPSDSAEGRSGNTAIGTSVVQHTTVVNVLSDGSDSVVNYTRLEIMPSYLNFVVEPGEEKEMTVTVWNRDTKPARVIPRVRQQPYSGPYIAERSWVAISPRDAEIPAGGSTKFSLTAAIPNGTLRGMYSSLVTFTDEEYPVSYPQPFPNYIHTLGLTLNVASSPLVQISTPYISDQLEAGREYTYAVDIKNLGSAPLGLNPKMSEDGYPMYGPYGPQEPPLDSSAFMITAPLTIPPQKNGTVTVRVNVPVNASGYFNGNLDLGIEDPSIRFEENRIQLNFLIWKQPAGSFSKTFPIKTSGPLSVELTSAYPMMNPVTVDGISRTIPKSDPSFDVTLIGPAGKTDLVLAEKVVRGSVNLGSDLSLGPGGKAGTYQESGSQNVFTYTARVYPGMWTLTILPKNTQSFDYRIIQGGKESAQTIPFVVFPQVFSGTP